MERPVAGTMAIDRTPSLLLAPENLDWTAQRVTSGRIAVARASHVARKLLAFPTQSTAWTSGKSLSADFGCAATDYVPNGPAAAYRATLSGKMFMLSKQGRFIKVDRTDPSVYQVLNLGKSFTRTFVTLSVCSDRGYVMADDGTFFIVDLKTMTILTSLDLGDGYGVAPFIDPYTSATGAGGVDDLYVPTNDGKVHRLRIANSATAPFYTYTGPTSYDVATAAVPLSGTRKIAAPPVVLGGVIYVGDQGGSLRVYDTADLANNYTYGVGGPINTAPAIEIQDGSYSLTDPLGAPKSVAPGTPAFAFVNAGGACAWINLHDTTTTFSQGLRIDDNDGGKKFGYLRDYNYSNAGTTEYLAAEDGGNINTESPDYDLPGTVPAAIWKNDYVVPAETNTRDDGGNPVANPLGGPIVSYLRWRSAVVHPVGAVINSAELDLKAAFDQGCRVPEVRTTSSFYQDLTGPWASDALTNASRPAIGSANIGVYLSGGVNGSGNVTYKDNKCYTWNVSAAFSAPTSRYALALKYNAGGDAVLWPEGPVGGAVGKKAKKAYQVEAVKFYNNALNADPAAGGEPCKAGEQRPILTLQIAAAQLPTASIETAPVIDAVSKRAYVFYTNALYQLDFSAPLKWADTDPATKTSLFNMAYYGDTANGGGTFWNKKRYVGNYTAPTLNYDATAAYVVNRYPSPNNLEFPGTWNYAVSKFTLPLSNASNRLVAGSPTFTGIAGAAKYDGTAPEASTFLVVDPFSNSYTTGGNVWFGLGNGKFYQYDR